MALRPFSGLWSQWWRVGGVLGIGFVLLAAVGAVLVGSAPTFDHPAAEIRTYFVEHGTRYLGADYLFGIALLLFLLPFLVTLRGVLGWAEGEPGILSWLSLIGGLVIVASATAAIAAWGALAMIIVADAEISDSSVRTIMYASARGDAVISLATPLLLFPASAVILQTGVLWRWLAYLGIGVGVLGVIGAAWIIDGSSDGILYAIGSVSIFGFALWVLLASVNLLSQRELPPRQNGA